MTNTIIIPGSPVAPGVPNGAAAKSQQLVRISAQTRKLRRVELDALLFAYTFSLECIIDCQETRDGFEEFLKRNKNQESYMFMCMVEDYQKLKAAKNRRKMAAEICQSFLLDNAPFQLNLSSSVRQQLIQKWESSDSASKYLFDQIIAVIFVQLNEEALPRFSQSNEFRVAMTNLVSMHGLAHAISIVDGNIRPHLQVETAAADELSPASSLSAQRHMSLPASAALATDSIRRTSLTTSTSEDEEDTSAEVQQDSATEIHEVDSYSEVSDAIGTPSSPVVSPQADLSPQLAVVLRQKSNLSKAVQEERRKHLNTKYVTGFHDKCESFDVTAFHLERLKALHDPKNESLLWNVNQKDSIQTLRTSKKYFHVGSSSRITAWNNSTMLEGFTPCQVLHALVTKEGRLCSYTDLSDSMFVRYISTINTVKSNLEALKKKTDGLSVKDFDGAVLFSGFVLRETLRMPKPMKHRYFFSMNSPVADEKSGAYYVMTQSFAEDTQYAVTPRLGLSQMFSAAIYEPMCSSPGSPISGTKIHECTAYNANTFLPSSMMAVMTTSRASSFEDQMALLAKRAEKEQLDAAPKDDYGKSFFRAIQENQEILNLVEEAKRAHFGDACYEAHCDVEHEQLPQSK